VLGPVRSVQDKTAIKVGETAYFGVRRTPAPQLPMLAGGCVDRRLPPVAETPPEDPHPPTGHQEQCCL